MRRRRFFQLAGGIGIAALAGCLDDDDPDDDNGAASPSDADDDTDDPTDKDDDQRMELTDDFDSYISDTVVHLDLPEEGVLMYEMTTEWDLADDRIYRRVETSMGDDSDDEIPVMEYYVIGDTTYQLTVQDQDSRCATWDGRLIRRDELREAGIRLPDAQDIEDADAINLEQLEPTDVDGEPVEVWQFDLGETLEFHAGEMTVYISRETGYILLIESWYETGQADDPMIVEFEQRNHSFNEELDIAVPEACE